MDQPKISVIVPVYNPGIHFENCLTSLVKQTLQDIEIILILDCPTDGCEKIAEKYAENDKRIKLIYNKENIHIGLSRNKGLEMATGEYIGFHDADDYSEPAMYELLYKEAKRNELDVVRCNFKCIYPTKSGLGIEPYKYPEVTQTVDSKEYIYEKVCGDTVSCVIWNHIFKTEFLTEHNIKFADSRYITSEDSIFFIEVYKNIDKLGIVPDYLYFHIFHQTNTGKSYKYRSVKNRILFFEKLYTFLKENNIEETKSLSFLSKNALKSLYSASHQALKIFPIKKAFEEIRLIRNNQLMMDCISFMYKKENRNELFKMKSTIIVFFYIMWVVSRKGK